MSGGEASVLLELHAAAAPFVAGRDYRHAAARQRLRQALVALLRQHDAPTPAELIDDKVEALTALRRLIQRCADLGVAWPDVVAIVNRDWEGDGQ